MPIALTIAGFDPSSGAGITADLMVFAAHGLFGTSCITALTVQSTLGVKATYPVESLLIKQTLECLDADLPPAGVKIGMLGSSNNIHVISNYLDKCNATDPGNSEVFSVLDPVIRSSSGRELLDAAGLTAMQQHLLPLVGWITPNSAELAILSGNPVGTREDVPKACRLLQQSVARAGGRKKIGIIATGGHLTSPDDYMLTPEGEEFWCPGTRIETTATHGTGCAFSSSFLSRLILGDRPDQGLNAAKNYVAGGLQSAVPVGHGNSPMNYLWNV